MKLNELLEYAVYINKASKQTINPAIQFSSKLIYKDNQYKEFKFLSFYINKGKCFLSKNNKSVKWLDKINMFEAKRFQTISEIMETKKYNDDLEFSDEFYRNGKLFLPAVLNNVFQFKANSITIFANKFYNRYDVFKNYYFCHYDLYQFDSLEKIIETAKEM